MPGLILRISRFLAFTLLLLGLALPWFRVPVGLQEDAYGAYTVIFQQPASTIVFKIFVGAALLIACSVGYWQRRSRRFVWAAPMTVSGCLLLIALGIVYPALTAQRCAEVSAHAAWLQEQNFSLINASGDTFTAQEYSYQPGQAEVLIKEVLPRAFQALPTPSILAVSDLHLAKLQRISTWLGMSPAFCQFVSSGWFCGLFGSFLLALSFAPLQSNENVRSNDFRRAYHIVGSFVVAAVAVCVACLLPIMMAGRQLAKAQTAVNEGKFAESLQHLDLAQVWVPVLAYHTDVLYQRGWLERKLGIKSPVTQLYSAIREEIEGFTTRAAENYAELLDPENPREVRDEAYRCTLRLAIKDYNSGLVDRAAFRFSQLTAIDPTSVKACYALQLADLRKVRKQQLESDVAKFEAIYNCFQSREKHPLLAMAHRRLADLEFECRDISKLGDEMRAAVKPHDL
jgi:tetratricopeptide (TPR) repeat protein